MFTDGVTLKRTGTIGATPVELSKTVCVTPGKPELRIHYRLRNLASNELHTPFGIEWNLSLQAPNSPKHYFSLPDSNVQRRPLRETGEHVNVREVLLADEHEGVAAHFEFVSPVKLWRVPVESVSLSEGGFERIFQSIALLFQWELHLAPRAEWEQKFTVTLTDA